MYFELPDKSVLDKDGNVIHFSPKRFIADIVDGNCCFICGAQPDQAEFNREHIIPNWILKKYKLHDTAIALPNDVALRYDRYTLPCCVDCNSLMSDELEMPVSALIDAGYDALVKHLSEEGPHLLFVWLSLIFLKAYLKDTELRQHLDFRKGKELISDAYTWEDLHHIHCVARSFYSGANLDPSAFGSLFICRAKQADYFQEFDYRDEYFSQSILLRLGDIALFAVLNDARVSINCIQSALSRLTGPLSPVQLRELLAHFAYVNRRLTKRPRFFTHVQPIAEQSEIWAEVPDGMSLTEPSPALLGELTYSCCKDILESYRLSVDIDAVKRGNWAFLFRADGSFISDSIERRQDKVTGT